MATLATNAYTLVDAAKVLKPDGSVETAIAELLTETNEVLEDILWMPTNDNTTHRIVVDTSLPASTFRGPNEGVDPVKSTQTQLTETTAEIVQLSQLDKTIADLNGNTEQFRLTWSRKHFNGLNQDFVDNLIYGDYTSNPKKFHGLAPRYNSLSGNNADNVINGGGVGADNTSIWLVGWADHTIYGIYPRGMTAGLQRTEGNGNAGDGTDWAFDSNNKRFRAYLDWYQWNCGLAVQDWRYAVRICNIDKSNLVAQSSAADLIDLMTRAIDRLPTLQGVKPAFYMNRVTRTELKLQAQDKSTSAMSIERAQDQVRYDFMGIPIRLCDAILNTEAQIT